MIFALNSYEHYDNTVLLNQINLETLIILHKFDTRHLNNPLNLKREINTDSPVQGHRVHIKPQLKERMSPLTYIGGPFF